MIVDLKLSSLWPFLVKDKNETEKGFYSESEEEGEEEADSSGTTESADSGEDDSDEEESGTRGSCFDF